MSEKLTKKQKAMSNINWNNYGIPKITNARIIPKKSKRESCRSSNDRALSGEGFVINSRKPLTPGGGVL